MCADDSRVAVDGYGEAELVTRRRATRCEFCTLGTSGGVEEVCGAGIQAIVVVTSCSDDGCVAADVD